MPIKHAQARIKADVLDELRREYKGAGTGPGHTWTDANFKFAPPSDSWLRGLKPLAALKVEMKFKATSQFDVYLVGEATAGGPVKTHVGTIKDGA